MNTRQRLFSIWLAVFFLFLSGLGAGVRAQTATLSGDLPFPPGKVSERLRYIPYDSLKEVLEKDPTWVIITRSQYEALKDTKDAFLAKQPSSPEPTLGADYVFGVAHYQGTIKGRVAEFEARIPFTLADRAWTLLPLPSGDLGLIEAELDGKPAGTVVRSFTGIQDGEAPKGRVAVLQQKMADPRRNRLLRGQAPRRVGQANDFFLVVSGPGTHELVLRYVVPLADDPEKHELTFRIPRVPLSTFQIRLESPDQFAEVDRAEGVVCRDEAKTATLVEGALGSTDRFTVRWAPRTVAALPAPQPEPQPVPEPGKPEPVVASQPQVVVRPPEEKAKIYADSFSLVSIGDGFVRQEATVRLSISRAARGTISFLFPPGADILDIRSPRLENTQITRVGSGTRVLCRLNAKIQGNVEFTLVSETKIAENLEAIIVPVHRVEDVERERGFVGIEPRTSIEIRKEALGEDEESAAGSDSGISWIDVAELPTEVSSRATRPVLLAFRYNQPPVEKPVRVLAKWHRDYALLNATAHRMGVSTLLEADGNSFTSMELSLKANGKQFLEVALPNGVDLESASLDGAPITPTMKASDTRLISLTGKKTSREANRQCLVNLVFRTKQASLGNFQRLPLSLPKIDIPVSMVQWTLYGPEQFALLPLPSKMMPIPRNIRLGFLDFSREVAPTFLMVMVLGYLGFKFWQYLKSIQAAQAAQEPGTAEGWTVGGVVKSVVVIGIVLAVLASVGGPMVGSITDQGKSARMFESINQRLDAPSMSVPPMAPSVAPMESDRYESQELADDVSSLGASKMEESKSNSARGMIAGKPKAAKAPQTFRVRSSRDAGALPVEITIPTTANAITVQRDLVAAQETLAMRVIILWKPLESLLTFFLGAIGLGVFLFVLLLSQGQRFTTAFLVFGGYLMASLVLEQFWTHSQWPGQTALLLGMCLLLLGRIIQGLRARAIITLILISLSLLGYQSGASAAELDPRVEQVIDVFVPFKQLEERLPKDGNLVFLKLEEYKYLRDLGLPKPDPTRWLPPVGVSYHLATFSGQVLEDRVELHLRMEVELLGKGFKQIEFPCQGIGVKELTLNGRKAWLKPLMRGSEPQGYQQEGQLMDMQNMNQMRQQMAQQAVQQMAPSNQLNMMNNVSNEAPMRRAPVERAAIITEESGLAVIEATIVKDLNVRTDPNQKTTGFRLPLPAFSAARMDLVIPRPGLKVEIQPSAWVESVDQGGKTLVKSVLQPSFEFSMEWREGTTTPEPVVEPEPGAEVASAAAEPIVDLPPKVFVDHEVLTGISEGALVTSDLMKLNIEQAPISEVVFRAPAGLEIMTVSGSDVAAWKTEPASEAQMVRVSFHAARQERVEIQVLGERAIQNMNGSYSLDLFQLLNVGQRGTVERERWLLGVETQGSFAVEMVQVSPDSFCDVQQLPESIGSRARGFMTHACKFLKFPEGAILEIAKHREVAVSTAQIDGVHATTRLTLDGRAMTRINIVVRNNNNQFLIINEMPNKTMRLLCVQVDGELVKAGSDPDGRVYIPLVRSPRADKGYSPFTVVVHVEDIVPSLRKPTRLNLALPHFSFDISLMNWTVMAPPEVFFMKAGGPFQAGSGPMPQVPGPFSVRSRDQIANLMQNQVMMKGGRPEESGSSAFAGGGAGRLPVEPELPGTGNVRVFNKKLVLAKDQSPVLQLVSMQENLLRPFLVLFILALAFLTASALNGIWQDLSGSWALKAAIILGVEALILLTDWLLPVEFPILPRIQAGFWEGLIAGFVVWVLWRILCGFETKTAETGSTAPAKT